MVNMTRPDTKNRDKLLRALIDRGISNSTIAEIVKPMRGKTQEEKEQIAMKLLKEYEIN